MLDEYLSVFKVTAFIIEGVIRRFCFRKLQSFSGESLHAPRSRIHGVLNRIK